VGVYRWQATRRHFPRWQCELHAACGLPSGTACQIRVAALGVSDSGSAVDPPRQPGQRFFRWRLLLSLPRPALRAPGHTDSAHSRPGTTASNDRHADRARRYRRGFSSFRGQRRGRGLFARLLFVQNLPGTTDGRPADVGTAFFVFNSGANRAQVASSAGHGNVSEYGFNSAGGTLTEISFPASKSVRPRAT